MYTITVLVYVLITLNITSNLAQNNKMITDQNIKISAQNIKITNDLVILLRLIVTFTYFRIRNYSHSCVFFRKINFELL